MKKKLVSVREKIRKNEERIRVMEEELKALRQLERQIEDEEILAMLRQMVGKEGNALDALRLVQQSQGMKAVGKKGVVEHE